MQRVNLTPDLTFSRLVYGMWRIGDDADTSAKHVQAKIEACLSQGITTMDQADIYGDYTAEAILGNALKASPGLRDKLEGLGMQVDFAAGDEVVRQMAQMTDTWGRMIRASGFKPQ